MQKLLKVYLLVVLVLAAVMPTGVRSDDTINIVVLSSDQLTSTLRAVSGAKKVISQSHETAVFYDFQANQAESLEKSTIDSVKSLNPRLILSIGTSATRLAKEHFPKIPIVFAAVKYPVISGFVESMREPGANITGSSLDIPTDIQFRYFKTIVPDLKKVGVLYTVQTEPLIAPAKLVARQMDLELVAIKITDIKQLPAALDSLSRSVDGMWSLADPELFSPQSTRFILLTTMRMNIPLMGFSRHVVESGALFALDFDYKGVGRQAGQIVSKVINGEQPSDIPVSMVDLLWFHYNERTAQHLAIQIPSEMVAVAKEVYR